MGDLFEHIDDLLDFPDDVLGLVEPCNQSAHLFLPAATVPASADGLLGGVGEDSLDGSSSRSNKSGAPFSAAEDKLGPVSYSLSPSSWVDLKDLVGSK